MGHVDAGKDGDIYERLWGHFLKDDFPEWERFWAHHVVPLTYRIDDQRKNGPGKLFFREDRKIHGGVESLVMANYSVFYYLARSCAVVSLEPHLFPEDAFVLLQAATENVQGFLNVLTHRLADPLGLDKSKLPNYEHIKATPVAQDIVKYRNAFVHFARLGRNPNLLGNTSRIVRRLPQRSFRGGM